MKSFLLSIVLSCFVLNLFAQDLTGTWFGTLSVQGTQLSLIFHFTKKGDAYSATLDSPDQKAFGLAVDQVSYIPPVLKLAATSLGIRYEGKYQASSKSIEGTFYQGQAVLPLILSKSKPLNTGKFEPKKRRPQDPAIFPYLQEEVKFENKKAGCTLAGTLTLPRGDKPKSIAVLISGSGPQNRNEELDFVNQRPFLVWSDWLTRQGIGVLRYDDRGVAASTGDFQKATTADFAEDAAAAVAYLRSRKDLDGLPIGLLGHSEGGMIAPIVAAGDPHLAYIVLLAGPGVPIKELMLKQFAMQEHLVGLPENVIQINQKIRREMFDYIIPSQIHDQEQLKNSVTVLLKNAMDKYPSASVDSNAKKAMILQQASTFTSPWFRYFLGFQPQFYLSRVSCPVLALNGSLDSQVSPKENLEAIRQSMVLAKNTRSRIEELPGLNHLFQKAVNGGINEYGTIEETVNPVALKLVSDWITKQ